MLIWAHGKLKAINKSTGCLFSCFNYVFLTKPLNFSWINPVVFLHCAFVQCCSRKRVCVLMLHRYRAAELQIRRYTRIWRASVLATLPGSSHSPNDRSPLNPAPTGQLWLGKRHSGVAGGSRNMWGSSVWMPVGISVEKESGPVRISPQPSPLHTWCLVKRGPWPGRSVSYTWYFWHLLAGLSHILMWDEAEYNLSIFLL